jgi:hypothetical protein
MAGRMRRKDLSTWLRFPEFWMADSPIPRQQYEAVMGHDPSEFAEDPDLPVENVNWVEACEYCSRLRERGGKGAARLADLDSKYSPSFLHEGSLADRLAHTRKPGGSMLLQLFLAGVGTVDFLVAKPSACLGLCGSLEFAIASQRRGGVP